MGEETILMYGMPVLSLYDYRAHSYILGDAGLPWWILIDTRQTLPAKSVEDSVRGGVGVSAQALPH